MIIKIIELLTAITEINNLSGRKVVKELIGVTIQNNENIDRALKRFKKKYERSGVLREYKKRTAFMKPSVEKRLSRLKAERRQHRASMEAE